MVVCVPGGIALLAPVQTRPPPLVAVDIEHQHLLLLCARTVMRLTQGCSTQKLNCVVPDRCESRSRIQFRSSLLFVPYSAENPPVKKTDYA